MLLSRVLCRLLKKKRKSIFDCEKIFENWRQTAFAPEQNYKLLSSGEEERIKLLIIKAPGSLGAPQAQDDPRTRKLPAGEAINE